MRQKLSVSLLVGLTLFWLTARPSRAEATKPAEGSWTSSCPSIEADVAAGKPLTLLVVVPLCDSRLIHCGAVFVVAARPERARYSVKQKP